MPAATAASEAVQLALVGSMATDDPEGWEFFHRTFEYAGSDPAIKILNNLNNVGLVDPVTREEITDPGEKNTHFPLHEFLQQVRSLAVK